MGILAQPALASAKLNAATQALPFAEEIRIAPKNSSQHFEVKWRLAVIRASQ
jgi:hypothetical protein